ncbi:putative inactive nicotinamidase [Cocos nucifera]|uniref:Putative inactive nicotinamidase n=1 Tax=Cocos nucifera TaxID=13894 RepID=A0A8K0I3C4_COCNU|nr:putative inactive nicotinamidase [Cocos nucifera]
MSIATISPFLSTGPFFPRNHNSKPLIRTQRGARWRDQAPSRAISLVPRRTSTEPTMTAFLSSGHSGRSAAAISAAQISGETVQSNAEKWSKTAMLIIDMQVVREHDPLGRDVELFRRHLYTDGKGPATNGSRGADLVDGLLIKEGDYKLVKTRFSAFCATQLHSLLQTSGVKSLVVVGVQTPNCIRQTVFDAVSLDYQSVTVIIDATAAATPEIHLANIRDMKNIGVATPTL